MARGERDSALAAYEALAPRYDELTARNNYELWLAGLLPELRRLGLPDEGRLLDVACGSGNSLKPMLERNWQAVGCDLSPSMIDLARSKLAEPTSLCVYDVRHLPRLGQFDLVWAVDDAFNYLLEDSDLPVALERMRDNLAEGGLLVFDLTTLATYRNAFTAQNTTVLVDTPGRSIHWVGLTPPDIPPGAICEARIEGDGLASHIHRQRHYPEAKVREAILAAGLACLTVYGIEELGVEPDGVPRRPLHELVHQKAVYVCGLRS